MHPVESFTWFSTVLLHAGPSMARPFASLSQADRCPSAEPTRNTPCSGRGVLTAALLLLLWFAVCLSHPIHFYYNKLHADISPIPGHHGYNAYKGQSFHWLHHRYFECNYGSELVPFDHMFGTYRKEL